MELPTDGTDGTDCHCMQHFTGTRLSSTNFCEAPSACFPSAAICEATCVEGLHRPCPGHVAGVSHKARFPIICFLCFFFVTDFRGCASER